MRTAAMFRKGAAIYARNLVRASTHFLDVIIDDTQLPTMSDLPNLLRLLAEKSAKLGHFTLASGQQSNFYIDARLTTMSPEGLSTIGPLALLELDRAKWNVDAVGGLTLGADPISYAISYASSASLRPLRAFTVRKQIKTHGTQKLIEGPLRPGDRVAVVEDVITTGNSALQAVTAVREAGGIVAGVLALVDREQGGREILEQAGLSVITLTTATQILGFMDSSTPSR